MTVFLIILSYSMKSAAFIVTPAKIRKIIYISCV